MPMNQPQASQPGKQPETKWQGQPLKPLTRKQAAFVKHLVDNPKASATAAVQATYGRNDKPVDRNTAANIASTNLSKPNILNELAKHSSNAEYTLIELMEVSKEYAKEGGRDGASYASVAVQTANSILDRVHGKATQRIEQQSTAVVIQIDLTGVSSPENS